MISLQKTLQQRARRLGLPLDTVAKDYVIGHLLAAVSAQRELGSALVFKGGTALKKLYFGDYRFSEDLDYTAVKEPSGKALEAALRDAVSLADEFGGMLQKEFGGRRAFEEGPEGAGVQ